jgi:hypothetical protein
MRFDSRLLSVFLLLRFAAETGRKKAGNKGETTMQLTEKYRPATWSDVVGQDKIVGRIRQLAQRGLAGRAYWISGQSGTGKTTIARLIAQDVASEWDTDEIDAGALTCATLREIERVLSLRGIPPDTAPERPMVQENLGPARESYPDCRRHADRRRENADRQAKEKSIRPCRSRPVFSLHAKMLRCGGPARATSRSGSSNAAII